MRQALSASPRQVRQSRERLFTLTNAHGISGDERRLAFGFLAFNSEDTCLRRRRQHQDVMRQALSASPRQVRQSRERLFR